MNQKHEIFKQNILEQKKLSSLKASSMPRFEPYALQTPQKKAESLQILQILQLEFLRIQREQQKETKALEGQNRVAYLQAARQKEEELRKDGCVSLFFLIALSSAFGINFVFYFLHQIQAYSH